MVVMDLIKGSLRLIGAIATGETPDAPEANEALMILNELMETLSIGTLSVWDQPTQTFNLVPSQFNYTIGPSANFNTVKPERITDAYIEDNGMSYPVQIITQQQYDELAYKGQSSPYPCYLCFVGNAGNANILLWPVPNKVITLTLNMTAQFTSFATLADAVLWPSGYKKMIRYLLAIDIAEEYGAEISPSLIGKSGEAVAAVKRLNNKKTTPLRFDQTLTGQHSFNQLLVGLSGGY